MSLISLILSVSLFSRQSFEDQPGPMLMRHPTLSQTSIVFQFAGDLWSVSRTGGPATRLTTAPGIESDPVFSPDGSMVAFTGQYDGNPDVFVIPATGGVPKRLTAHPAADVALGWTPDGKSVLFSSNMLSNTDYPRLFTVPVTGGVPKQLPFPAGVDGSFSPDGTHLAYVPNGKWEMAWKRYRGGQTTPIWIGNLANSRVKAVPRDGSDDHRPMWVGDSIYYLSDKEGPVGLYRFDTATGKVDEEIKGEGFDIKSASAGPDAIVYERLGSIALFDLATHQSKSVPIEIHGDFPEVRPEFKDVSGEVSSAGISPTGQRVVVAARGWIFTVPASKGDARLLDEKQGVHRKDPSWSPDGKFVAYLTDESGGEELALYDLKASTHRRISLGDPPAVFSNPVWSPDSSKIVYTDNRLKIWVLDVATGKNLFIDEGSYRGATDLSPRWSPDSKWLTWSRDLESHVNTVFLHSFETGKNTPITDGLADATSPVFDRDGKHLYFLASTNLGQSSDFEDLSSFNAPNSTSRVYAVVLRKDLPNPLQPESDEEVPKEDSKATAPAKEIKRTGIDLDDIEHRIIVLPMPERTYRSLEPGPEGTFFAISTTPRVTATGPGGPASVTKFSFSDRKAIPFATGVSGIQASADGSKLLLLEGGSTRIVSSAALPTPGQGDVNLSDLRVKIDPRLEWAAMYHEVWRNERLLFYAPNLHGIDSYAMERIYEPFLPNIRSRDDLNYLFTDMLGELSVGHMFINGGDIPRAKGVPGGLLGADFAFENGRYRIAKVYDGERWNPDLYSPLAQPGVNAKAGEYLIAVDGKDVTDAIDLYVALEGKAGKQVKIKIGATPDGKDAREAVVVPVGNEFGLRFKAWAEDNRRTVERMTGGRGGYVHVPDTDAGGWIAFNRYYYAQVQRHGMVVDDRFNHGGLINDFMVREMEKPLDFMSMTRHGQDIRIPVAGVYGPKVMLINEMAGSGGDIFPFLFRQHKVGKLIGKRTWGAMISSYGFQVIDGGSVRAPDDAMYNPETGEWVIENEGVPADIPVELDPYLWRQGRDAQLEAAIAELNLQMDAHPPLKVKRPAYPDKTKLPVGH